MRILITPTQTSIIKLSMSVSVVCVTKPVTIFMLGWMTEACKRSKTPENTTALSYIPLILGNFMR